MAGQIRVEFAGEGAGVGELSWGQREMWFKIRRRGCPLAFGAVIPLAPGAGADDSVRLLRFIMSRHPSLRTRLLVGEDGWTRQSVAASGEIGIEVVDAGGNDPGAAAEAVYQRFHEKDFDYGREWPVRMALIRSGDALTHLVVMYSHVALDGGGAAALVADLDGMDPVTGGSPAPVRGQPPLEQARSQAGPAGQRKSEATLRRWERMLRAIPANRFGDCGDGQEPRFRSAMLVSPAMYLAVPALAQAHDGDTSAVLLAAFAVAQSRVTGVSPSVMLLMASNRFRPGLGDSVSSIVQPGLCVIDTAGLTFDEVVAAARTRTFIAYKDAYYDPARRDELIASLSRERGEEIDLGCYFNDRRIGRQMPSGPVPAPAELRAAVTQGSLEWFAEPMDPVSESFEVFIEDTPGTISVRLACDTRYMSAASAGSFAREMENVTVQAALALGQGAVSSLT